MKLSLFLKQFPALDVPVINVRSGSMLPDFYDFIRAVYNRTGGADGIVPSLGTGLVAVGSIRTDALVLTDDWNEITNTPAGSGVSIPQLQTMQQIFIVNAGGNALKIYPPLSAAIDALAVNAPYSLANLKMQIFTFFATTRIRSMQLG